MFKLSSLVSLVFAFNGLSCLCFHLFFAFETGGGGGTCQNFDRNPRSIFWV